MVSRIKIVADTNFLFMSIYDEYGKAGKIVKAAVDRKIILFAPISVRKELIVVLKRKYNWNDNEIESEMESLPVKWIDEELYNSLLSLTTVKHKPDKPVEAVAILLNCKILSADTDFKGNERLMDIDKLLESLS
jgi:predicted nucleic acid-binding protein|tara:strand:+ start:450 stop:851 length:402 start_codon:yes stop_codon:yes gene_type:complete